MAGNSEKTAERPRGRGRPFSPGQSGNRNGRPKLPDDVKEAYKAMHPRALARLSELIDSKNEKVALRACELIVERVEGKVSQPIAHSGSVTFNVVDPFAEPKS